MRLRYEKCINSRAFTNPKQKINDKYVLLDKSLKRIENAIKNKIKDEKIKSAELISKLDAMSPLKTLTRGYSLTECNGKVITKSSMLVKDDEISITFQDGKKKARVL